MELYSGFARPCGRYASELEQRWAIQFAKWGWNARYIGDECRWADFDVDGIRIEVKPDGEEFVYEAAFRHGNILIMEGAPSFCRWWFVDYVCQPIQMPSHPLPIQIREVELFGRTHRIETPAEFMARIGYRFE